MCFEARTISRREVAEVSGYVDAYQDPYDATRSPLLTWEVITRITAEAEQAAEVAVAAEDVFDAYEEWQVVRRLERGPTLAAMEALRRYRSLNSLRWSTAKAYAVEAVAEAMLPRFEEWAKAQPEALRGVVAAAHLRSLEHKLSRLNAEATAADWTRTGWPELKSRIYHAIAEELTRRELRRAVDSRLNTVLNGVRSQIWTSLRDIPELLADPDYEAACAALEEAKRRG